MEILYFGKIAEMTGIQKEVIQEKLPLNELIKQLSTIYKFNEQSFKISLNQRLISADLNIELSDKDVIAFLPPFSGG